MGTMEAVVATSLKRSHVLSPQVQALKNSAMAAIVSVVYNFLSLFIHAISRIHSNYAKYAKYSHY
jgi:hypothetical protein